MQNYIRQELIKPNLNNKYNKLYEYDSINKIIINSNEFDVILKIKEPKIIKFLYFNKFNIHNKLINIDDIIDFNLNNLNIYFYFYLLLLILVNDTNNNYFFSIKFIKYFDDQIIRNKNAHYKILISAKIIIELINYYEKKNGENQELTKIKNYNMKIINNNISIFKDMDLEWKQEEFITKNIEDIYIDIIEKILIKENNFKNYDYLDSIVNQLDLLNIDLTKTMFDKLNNILNNNKEYIQKYIILEKKDLNNENKIYFYYIILKYILKNIFYIYQIPFLNRTKQFLINLSKNDKDINEISNYLKNNNINDKIVFIIKKIIDSEDDYNKFILNSNYSKQINGIDYNNYFELDDSYNEEKKTENLKSLTLPSKPIIKKYLDLEFIHNSNIICKILSDSSILFNIEKLDKKYKCEIQFENGKINYKNFKKYYKIKQNFNNEILNLLFLNYLNFIIFLKTIKKIAKNMAKDLKLKIVLKIKTIKEESGNDLDNICCEYILKSPNLFDIKKNNYKDNNILIDKKYDNFNLLLNDIIDIIYNDIPIKEKQNLSNISNIDYNNYSTTINSINEMNIKYSKYKIIRFLEIIGENNKPFEYVKELNNTKFIIAGTEDKLIRYDNSYNNEKKINFPNCKYYGFCELEKDKILFYSNNILKLYSLENLKEMKGEIKNISNIIFKNIIQIKRDKFIICSENNILQMKNLTNNNQQKFKEIYKKAYRGAIKINNNHYAFTSNRILSNGEDEIIIFNKISKKFTEIKGYSFLLSKNNLSIISIPDKYNKTKNDKLLFCACKKYFNSQKNGILLLKLKIIDNSISETYKIFDSTGNFEVHCFCNIFKVNNNNKTDNMKKEIENTEYILIGGYDINKRKGLIKLYKIIYNEDIERIKIEYIQDIQIGKDIKNINSKSFKGFKKPITCIKQSEENENLLISSFDGNIYLFSQPNLEKIINLKKKEIIKI